jgi:transposase-like protein
MEPDTKGKMSKVASPKTALAARIPRACSDEAAAVAFMEEQRWGDTPACPRCGDTDVVQMKAADGTRNARFLWRCHGCKKQFTVRVGTIMEDSPIPIRHWCLAFFRACSSKKGISALQIQRETHLTYRSALFMMHRIRWAMAPANEKESKLRGTVEFDETYVGGRPRLKSFHHWDGRVKKGPPADFEDRKTQVIAGVERGGRVHARVVIDRKEKMLKDQVREMVDPSARLMTDESTVYKGLGSEFAGGHDTVHHRRYEYVRDDVTTNTIEGFFAGLKRQIGGTHHSVSKKHLHRYVAESEFKYNSRDLDDSQRTVRAIQGAERKRLTYKEQTGRV